MCPVSPCGSDKPLPIMSWSVGLSRITLMENSLSLTWNRRLCGLMSRVTLQSVRARLITGPIHSGKKLSLCGGRLVLLPGNGTPVTFAIARQLSQQGFPQSLLPFRSPGFPGKFMLVPESESHPCGSQGEAMHRRQPEYSNGIPHRTSTAVGPEWYPLQTRYQCEKKVDVALRNEGFESFAPTCLEARRWSDRTKLVEAPLFPGYTFVRMEADPGIACQGIASARPGPIRDPWT